MTDEPKLLELLRTIKDGKGWTVDEALRALITNSLNTIPRPATRKPGRWRKAEVVSAFQDLVERTWVHEVPGHFSGEEAPPMVYTISANGRFRLVQADAN
jgi:hypothetical protein